MNESPTERDEKLLNAAENFAEAFPGAIKSKNSAKAPLFQEILSLIRTNPVGEPYSAVLSSGWMTQQRSTVLDHVLAIAQAGLFHLQADQANGEIKVSLTEVALLKGSFAKIREAEEEKRKIEEEDFARRYRADQAERRARFEAESAERVRQDLAKEEQRQRIESSKLIAATNGLFRAVIGIVDEKDASELQIDLLLKSIRALSWLTRRDGGLPIEKGVVGFLHQLKENEKFYSDNMR